jgi:hypothetical protein
METNAVPARSVPQILRELGSRADEFDFAGITEPDRIHILGTTGNQGVLRVEDRSGDSTGKVFTFREVRK